MLEFEDYLLHFIFVFFMTFLYPFFFYLIYEFVFFQGPFKTRRFKKHYKKKYPWLKRFFLITYFDKDLSDKCIYKKQLKWIVIADYFCAAWSVFNWIFLIASMQGQYFSWVGTEVFVYEVAFFVLGVWCLFHSTRWKDVATGKAGIGHAEFKIKLPNVEGEKTPNVEDEKSKDSVAARKTDDNAKYIKSFIIEFGKKCLVVAIVTGVFMVVCFVADKFI